MKLRTECYTDPPFKFGCACDVCDSQNKRVQILQYVGGTTDETDYATP